MNEVIVETEEKKKELSDRVEILSEEIKKESTGKKNIKHVLKTEIWDRYKKDKKLWVFAGGFFLFTGIGWYTQYKAIQEKSMIYQLSSWTSGLGIAKVCLYLGGGEVVYKLAREKLNGKLENIIYSPTMIKISHYIPRF